MVGKNILAIGWGRSCCPLRENFLGRDFEVDVSKGARKQQHSSLGLEFLGKDLVGELKKKKEFGTPGNAQVQLLEF